jgi:HAD superfamily hydrolase (TIGR01662 family)
VSLRVQAGNADDMLMRRLHGAGWRERAGAPSGRRARHLATTAAGVAAAVAAAARRPATAAVAAFAYAAGVAEFTVARVRPGPKTRDEITDMVLSSALIPAAATWHTLRGLVRHRHARPWRGVPELVLFDRDGTLVHDVPYNGDPEQVQPMADARASLDRLRSAGVRVGVITNQSGVAAGRITEDQVRAVNARVARELGPFDAWRYCPHEPQDGCGCRKPAPGMIKEICAELGVSPPQCVVVGDIGSDLGAAHAAGASAILVPTSTTRQDEIDAAERVAPDLPAAVDLLLGGAW